MFIPAVSFLRMLGESVGPLAWVVFAAAVVWFVAAIRHAPPDGQPRSDRRQDPGRPAEPTKLS
jgi:hypothetical protein